MKLYHVKGSHSDRCAWLLGELGAPCEIVPVDLQKGEHKQPAYLALHPLGQVPALVDGEASVFESAAILLYLADKFPDKRLAPPPSSIDRAAYLSWLTFASSSLGGCIDPLYVQLFYVPEDKRNHALVEQLRGMFATRVQALAARVTGRRFVVGDTLTAADVALASTLVHAQKAKLELPTPVAAYFATLSERPEFKKVFA